MIRQADRAYADFLHQEGYSAYNKSFKHFCFSNLYGFRYDRIKDRFKILSPQLKLDIAFRMDKTAEAFIMGVFKNQQFSLGDRNTQIGMEVAQVSACPITVSSREVVLQAKSPLVIARPKVHKSGKLGSDYLQPDDLGYKAIFFQNLLDKAKSVELPVDLQGQEQWGFEVIGTAPKSRLLTLKAHTPQETQVRGFVYRFRLKAPIPLIELGLDAGFGSQNAQGFGFCEVVEGKG